MVLKIQPLKILTIFCGLSLFAVSCGMSPWDQDEDSEENPQEQIAANPDEDTGTNEPFDPNAELSEAEAIQKADTDLTNLSELLSRLNINELHRSGAHGQGVKIAIFENGYLALKEGLGKRLPPDLKIEPAPKNKPTKSPHGTKMAELAYAVATGSVRYDASVPGPELLLFNTNGFSNLKAAVTSAIAQKVDIIVYAQSWAYGGNRDGRGFINLEFNRAAAAGIAVVAAAGNFAGAVYDGNLRLGSNVSAAGARDVILPHENRYVRFEIPEDNTPAKITLAWNDFTDDESYATSEDLDLFLEDANGKQLSVANLVQDPARVLRGEKGVVAQAREIINDVVLNRGTYKLRVSTKQTNFRSDARFWLTVSAEGARIIDNPSKNSILFPADNPNVITVGAEDVDFSSSRPAMNGERYPKPELAAPSIVFYDRGYSMAGSSTAVAITAGVLAAMKSQGKTFTRFDRSTILETMKAKNNLGKNNAAAAMPVIN